MPCAFEDGTPKRGLSLIPVPAACRNTLEPVAKGPVGR